MGQMTGKDWVVVILIAVLVIVLSTMTSWWGQLVFAVGYKMAMLIVAIVIAILVIAIIAMMIAAPDWWNNLFSTFRDNADDLIGLAGKGIEQAANSLAKGAASVIKELGLYALIGLGGFFLFKAIFLERRNNA